MKVWFYIVAIEENGWYNVALLSTADRVVSEFARKYPHAKIGSISRG